MNNHTRSHRLAVTACLMAVMLLFLTNWSTPSSATGTSERLTNTARGKHPPGVAAKTPAKARVIVQTNSERRKPAFAFKHQSAKRLTAQNDISTQLIPAVAIRVARPRNQSLLLGRAWTHETQIGKARAPALLRTTGDASRSSPIIPLRC